MTEKQLAASIVASLYGGPGMMAVLMGRLVIGAAFLLVAYFMYWALSTAGER